MQKIMSVLSGFVVTFSVKVLDIFDKVLAVCGFLDSL